MSHAWSFFFIVLTVSGCTPAAPCSTCPSVSGTYAVNWSADGGGSQQLLDGGVVACAGGPRPATWTFVTRGSNVTTVIGDTTIGGTLYDTYDLLMTGPGPGGASYRLRALVIPEGTSTDAGIRLQGKFTTRTVPSSGDPCESNDAFTALRQ